MDSKSIKELRERLRISQEAFAHLIGVSVVTVNRWENGKASPLRVYVKAMKKMGGGEGENAV